MRVFVFTWQCSQVVGKITLRQHFVNQIDHHLKTEGQKKKRELRSARQHFLKHNYNLEYFFYKSAFYLQCIALIAFSNFQYECSQDVESLAVAHCFIPAGVGQQHPLQHHPVLLPLLAAVRTAAGPVQVLGIRRMQGGLFFNKSAHYLDKWMMNLCI